MNYCSHKGLIRNYSSKNQMICILITCGHSVRYFNKVTLNFCVVILKYRFAEDAKRHQILIVLFFYQILE